MRAVIRNSGLEFPIDRIAVNLAPTCSGSGLRLVRSGDERKHFMSKRLKGEKKS